MIAHRLAAATALSTVFLLSACVVAPPPQRVVMVPQPMVQPAPVYAEFGRVANIGYIQVAQRPSGAGAILGAVIGGVVGNTLGGGAGRALATGAGVVGGAIAGNAIEGRAIQPDEVYRVQVRFDNGSVRDFDFQRIDDLRTGDRVKFEGGQLHRLP
jgi:outer membrane lipoprotein SlyB